MLSSNLEVTLLKIALCDAELILVTYGDRHKPLLHNESIHQPFHLIREVAKAKELHV